MERVIYYAAAFIAVILVFVPHEFAHALAAYKCGDSTAKAYGRLTLNPLKHISPQGFILCLLTGFGWARPVPVYPANFRHFRSGLFITAIAGVITNYIIAFIAYPLGQAALLLQPANQFAYYLILFVHLVFFLTYSFGLSVFVFNLLPLYPLDGFRVVESLTRELNPVRRFLKTYGQYVLIVLVLESFLCGILERYTSLPYVEYFDILGYLHWFAQNILGYPITALWNLVIPGA